MRVLPPAGGFLPPWSLLQNNGEFPAFMKRLPSNRILWGGSATEALFRILLILRERHSVERLYCAAYTCPDIVAAGRRAGLSVVLCDSDPTTLDMRPPEFFPPGPAVILFSNLYGVIERRGGWEEHLRRADIWVVNDRCQVQITQTSVFPPLAPREIILLSFGRGKGLCGLGGGCAIGEMLPADSPPINSSWSRRSIDLLRSTLCWLFESPSLYGLPANFPGLGIGETHYNKDFTLSQVSKLQLLCAGKLAALPGEVRGRNIQRWNAALEDLSVLRPAKERDEELTRFPVLVESAKRGVLLERLCHLGVTTSYPSTLLELCGGDVSPGSYPGATQISTTILTLPIHAGVRESDIERTATIFRSVLQ